MGSRVGCPYACYRRHSQKVMVGTFSTPILTFPRQGGRKFTYPCQPIEGDGLLHISRNSTNG